jgi:rubredoxin
MNVAKSGSSWDAQVPEYPAPLCPVCNIPKWVNKRYLAATKQFRTVRVGYECRLCAAKKRLTHVSVGNAQDTNRMPP